MYGYKIATMDYYKHRSIMTTINLLIPYPPSVNTYWGFHGHRRFLTPKANQFKEDVAQVVSQQPIYSLGLSRLEISITLYPTDKRVRDIDTSIKSCLDALVATKLFDDDSQVDVLLILRGEQKKGGQALVTIKTLD